MMTSVTAQTRHCEHCWCQTTVVEGVVHFVCCMCKTRMAASVRTTAVVDDRQ